MLRNWQLQARKNENEGIQLKMRFTIEWVILDNHVNDQTIQNRFFRYTFKVATQESYRIFRIFHTGKNSSSCGN